MAKGDAQAQPGGPPSMMRGASAPGANYKPGQNAQLPGTGIIKPQTPGQEQIAMQGGGFMGGSLPQGQPLPNTMGPSNPGALIAAILAQRYGGGSPTDPAGAMGVPPTPQDSNAGMAAQAGPLNPNNFGMLPAVNRPGPMGPGMDFGMLPPQSQAPMMNPWANMQMPPQDAVMRQPNMGIGPSDPSQLFRKYGQ